MREGKEIGGLCKVYQWKLGKEESKDTRRRVGDESGVRVRGF